MWPCVRYAVSPSSRFRLSAESGTIEVVRLGLIGDVHAEDELVLATLEALRKERVDHVLCTGDLVDGLGDVDRACGYLREANVLTVRGNHDRWIRSDEMRTLPNAHKMTELSVETIALLKSLPSTASLDILGGGKLLLCHGVGRNDMRRLQADDRGHAISSNDDLLGVLFDAGIRLMIAGHTHQQMLRRFERGGGRPPLFAINPGTLAREDEPGFAIVDLKAARVEFRRFTSDRLVVHASSALL
ncbi:MAG TPA: metallophosphoesterase family protein [Labilithrix sp.]|nr:metallophosphoesterase family protein [Labilithrix sp.]